MTLEELKAEWIANQRAADTVHAALAKTDMWKVWRQLQDDANKAQGDYARMMNEVKDE